MAPAPPLPVTEDTPPDMLAGAMDLRVVLPGGRAVRMSAERCTQMMDLLVQITTAHKMAPGGYVLQPVGERGILPYKPSTPIGALDTWTIQIVPKPRNLNTNSIKKAPLKPNNQQPFEQTFRLQVHLPRNQLFVTRVSPKCLLSDVLLLACTEKNLDPNKYELRHPANLEERLRPEWTLADYKLQEVTLVAKGNRPLGSGLSSSDIMALQKEEEKRRQQVKANGTAGSTVLGLMLGKNSQSSGCDGSISSDSLGGRSISPSRSDETPSPPGSSLPPPRPIRKRRPAPKPPTQAPQPQQHSQAVISHSRNSSDSSGYHEASILSESPESNGQSSSPSGTLPRRSKLTGNPAQPTNVATTNNLSRSLSNLAHISNGEHNSRPLSSSMQKNGHSVSTTSLASSGLGKKKKAAPPPPPLVKSMASGHLLPEQRTASLSTLSSQSSSDSFDREIYSRTGTLERPPSSQSSTTSNFARPDSLPEESSIPEENENQSSQDVSNTLLKTYEHPEPLHLEGETDKTDAQVLLQPVNNHLQNFSETCNLTEPDLPSQIQQNLVSLKPQPLSGTQNPASFEEPSEFVAETVDAVINQHNLTSVFPKKGVAPPRTVLPDVVSAGKKKAPTPKPRVTLISSSKIISPTPRPRTRRCIETSIQQSESHVPLNDSLKIDSEIDFIEIKSNSSKSSDEMQKSGKFGGAFGVGKTMVMLAASASDSSSRESCCNKNNVHNLDCNEEMITRFGTDNDYEEGNNGDDDDDDGLDMSENDLEMFEIKSDNLDSPPVETLVHDSVSILDSLSIASSVFDSEHETSDGTWDRCSFDSKERNRLGSRLSLQPISVKERESPRASSLQSMEEVPMFLERDCQLGRWDSSEDLQGNGDVHCTSQRTDLEKERDEIQKDFESVTKELQEVILAEEAKQDSSVRNIPSPKTESPSLSMVDWEYHLPAPPSAFRDNQSPIPSREVDNSSLIPEVSVFDEASPEVLPPAEFTDNNKSSIETETNLVSLMMEKESPLILNLVNGVTKVNPLFSEEKYEEDSLKERKQSSLRNEYLTVNGKTGEKMTECEEDWRPQQIADYPDSTAETVKEKRAPLQSSENNRQFNESHQANQLSNFTISTYEKPRDIDTLFQESNAIQKEESEFKKPVVTSLYRRANSTTLSSNISRNNSFSSKDNPNYERTSVKRSMSHASNSGRTLRAKSIGNLTLEASRDGGELQKSESRMNERHEGLRKTTSEANINQDYGKSNRLAELQDQFLQWQEQLLRQTQPDIPLQSLQVLRRILSPSQDNSHDKDKDKKLIGEASLSSKIAASSNVRSNEDADISEANMKQTISHEDQLHRQTSSTSSNHKRYSYHGPPAVNFTTWSERPKSQVSIKVDNDYRIGKGQLGPLVSDKVENGLDVKEANLTEDQVDAKQNCIVTRSENMTPANDHMKVEPTALTMRIISHSTPSGYKKTSTSLSQDLAQNPNKETSISHLEGSRVYNYNSAQIADPSRVPIVRAVELKKSALHAQQNTSERRENTSTVKLRKKEDNNQNVKDSLDNGDRSNDDAEEKFLGVNNLAKRFSLGVSNSESVKVNYIKPRPASVYSSSDSKPKINSHINKVVVNNMKDFNGISNSNGISTGKKYTSVVGINGMDTHEDSLQQNSRQTPKVNEASTLQRNDSTSLSKPTIPVSARYPMPVVKGFRYATNDYSDSSLVAADSYKMLQNSQQPVTVKILQSNSFSNPAQRNTVIEPLPSVSLRIQPSSLKSSQVPSKEKSDPPSAPPLPKKIPSARPKSLPAPEANPRDQLMDSIRNFGREKLKHVRSTPPSNVLLIM